ncbi:MAG TPA: hypothetical protein VE110_06655 [Gemmatimonadaceae bacterium]|nr:hypothetical protein [Gemmatimonadaceae bacterium]
MARIQRTLSTVAIGIVMISASALAQSGASSSLTHTVSVTVPPRVKVQVATLAAIAPAVSAGNVVASGQGLALSVRATRPWVLSIGTSSKKQVASSVRWSVGDGSDYSNLTFASVAIASGTLSTEAADARVYFQSISQKSTADRDDATVVLTMVAP